MFWPEVRRGSERFLRDLADGLLAHGDRVRLITSHRGRPQTTVEDGLTVVRVPRPPGGGRLARRHVEDHLLHLPLSYAALRRGREDVAHAVYATDALVAARWGRERGRPSVFSFMGVPHRQGLANRRHRKELTVRACEEADAVCVLSEEAGEAMARWLGVQAEVIAPGVDLHAFTPAPDPAAARAEHPTVVCAADPAEPRKRVGLLAEALACGTPVVGPTRAVIGDQGELFTGEQDDPSELATALERALDRARDPATPAACRAQAERFGLDATVTAYRALYDRL